MFNNKQAIFLGISKKENMILSCIRAVPKNIFRINKETNISRSTLYLALERLYKRGLIIVKINENRSAFQTKMPDDLKYEFEEIIDSI